MKMLILLNVMIFSFSVFGTVSFDREKNLDQIKLRGAVNTWCYDINGRAMQVSYLCREDYLEGGNYSKLIVTNQSIDADFVKLQRKGSKYIKSSKFDAIKGESVASFNLWVGSLFQRPLLQPGLNNIRYRFYKDKKLVLEGLFEVEVANEVTRDCGFGHLPSIPSCGNQTIVCNRFFREYNYCE